MNLINSEKKEKNEIELTIGVSAEELDAAVNKAYIKNRTRINVPGFRKGKAPRRIVEKMYGIGVFLNDAIDILLPDVLSFATEDSGLDVVGYPKVTAIDLKDNDTRAEIKLVTGLRPDVTVGKYKGLSAPKPALEVAEQEILDEIETIRQRNARIETVERAAAMGDVTVIDFEGFLDGVPFEGGKGESFELELGSGRFIPGFEEKLVGMNASEERDIDLVFPENYKEDLAGKAVVFKVKLLELKEKQLPELDDEFAKDVSEFDTLDEYKASIRERIEKDRKAQIDETFEGLLMDQIVESAQAEIPEPLIEEEVDKAAQNFSRQISAYGMQPAQYMQMMGLDPDSFKEKLRENVTRQTKLSFALEEIAKIEGIAVTPDEIEEEYKRAAEEYKTEVEKLKENVKSDDIERDLKLRAAAKLVVDSAKIEPESKTESKSEGKPKGKPKGKSKEKSADKPESKSAEKPADSESK